MPFKTNLNKDVLNLICNFAGINSSFYYYKQEKRSKEGFKNLKLEYKCNKCNKTIRNLKTAKYGFILEYYDYYNVNMTDYYVNDGISKFYHSKYQSFRDGMTNTRNENLRLLLDKKNGELDETRPYHYILRMKNTWDDGKILGKIILKTINHLDSIYHKFNREKRRLERCGIDIKVEIENKNSCINKIKKSLLDLNKEELLLGYYCSGCTKTTNFSNFIKY